MPPTCTHIWLHLPRLRITKRMLTYWCVPYVVWWPPVHRGLAGLGVSSSLGKWCAAPRDARYLVSNSLLATAPGERTSQHWLLKRLPARGSASALWIYLQGSLPKRMTCCALWCMQHRSPRPFNTCNKWACASPHGLPWRMPVLGTAVASWTCRAPG